MTYKWGKRTAPPSAGPIKSMAYAVDNRIAHLVAVATCHVESVLVFCAFRLRYAHCRQASEQCRVSSRVVVKYCLQAAHLSCRRLSFRLCLWWHRFEQTTSCHPGKPRIIIGSPHPAQARLKRSRGSLVISAFQQSPQIETLSQPGHASIASSTR